MVNKRSIHQSKPSNVAFESPPSNAVKKAEYRDMDRAPHKPPFELKFEGSPIVRQKDLNEVRKRLDFSS